MRGRLEEDRPRGRNAAGLRETFESAADGYDAARPSYPKQLFDDLVELAELRPRARLLEIGCATGKATRPLLERGFSVVCVELGVRLAKRARANLAGMPAEIHVAPFEVWENEDDPFDLVYAATAWHWIDPAIRYREAYELLRPTGHLAFWSAQHAFPVDYDPFFAEIQEVYDAIGENRPGESPPSPPDRVPDDVAEIEATGLFEGIHVRRYVWDWNAILHVARRIHGAGHASVWGGSGFGWTTALSLGPIPE
jgi:SAM-dependent methyltransferase